MPADSSFAGFERLWLQSDLSAAETLPLPCGRAALFACGYEAGHNQDALAAIAVDGTWALVAVADGAGGQASGGEASSLAVRELLGAVRQSVAAGAPAGAGIVAGFDAANAAIQKLGVGAASTLAVAELDGSSVRTYHAGDSAVLITGQRGRIKLQTIAHSPVGYAQEAGVLSEREALHHEERHLVSNMLGSAEMRIEVGPPLTLAPHDTLVLASDGLFDNLSLGEIAERVRKGPLEDAAARLASAALSRMGDPRPGAPSKPDDLAFVLYRPARA
ncbi:MAG: protein phosphatase 2C domain-containing protein [Myxococcales bacterium]|nr:protein phosphatase 2C domain-containing protein [Myxococcales bacterium]